MAGGSRQVGRNKICVCVQNAQAECAVKGSVIEKEKCLQ